jgi:hypothetical protein
MTTQPAPAPRDDPFFRRLAALLAEIAADADASLAPPDKDADPDAGEARVGGSER